MHINVEPVPLMENIFEAGEQFVFSPEQAEAIRDKDRFICSKLTVFINDSVSYQDYQFEMVKVKTLKGQHDLDAAGSFNWSQRVTRLFLVAGPSATFLVTAGEKTKPSLVKGLRSALVKFEGYPPSIEQTAVVVYDHELGQMYHGYLLGFRLPAKDIERVKKS